MQARKNLILFLFILFSSLTSKSQVMFSSSPGIIDSSAMLEIKSADRGGTTSGFHPTTQSN